MPAGLHFQPARAWCVAPARKGIPMENGSHFPSATPRSQPRRLRRIAGMACGAVAVGATAMLVAEATGGSARTDRVGLAASAPAAPGTSTTGAVPTTGVVPTTGAVPTTDAPSTTTTPAPPTPVLPDGSALPVLVVFNGNTITLAGSVPNAADAAQLRALAEANSKTSGAQVIDQLVVDARVPRSVGVRVIEMNAVRFASGSSQVT
ncbi:MAG TPA: hypothetical protein VKV34_03885, partial [Thermoleophilia bacterium]|nr:hypothetical protein [Thermoleophilia bacterium]